MKEATEGTPAEKLAESGGVPAAQIGTYPSSITFTLPDSGKEVVMRKPMLSDSLAASSDPTAVGGVKATVALMAQICLIDGKPMNWQDWGKTFSLIDYNVITAKYTDEITEPGK